MAERPQLESADFDVVIVGGGINGAGVARDAAERGFRVALVERDDFGCGASSRTSKMVHGGIRYLEHGALRLVWEASHERRRLLRLAPHLVQPLPFVFPVYRGGRIGPLRLRAGMWLYDVLAAFRNVRRHRMLRPRDAASWGAGLRRESLHGAARYWDAAMDDARLVLANVLAARAAGARTWNGVTAETLQLQDGTVRGVQVLETATAERATLRARCTVLCAGPWTNAFLASLPGAPRPLAPTRGTHLVLPPFVDRAFTLSASRDGRVFFVLPWLGVTLVGTTDVEDRGDPDRVAPADEEIDYLLAETNHYFPAARLGRADVLAAFAGLRPLLRAGGDASARSREHALLEPVPHLLVVAGGKYTTYRTVAESVVDRIEARLGRRGPCRTAVEPLPGGDLRLVWPEEAGMEGGSLSWSARDHWAAGPSFQAAAAALARYAGLEVEAAAHLLRRHGSRAMQVAALARAEPRLAAPLCPHQPDRRAEVVHAVRHEMALHLEDWYLRRSRQAFAACRGLEALDEVAALFAAELDWSEAQRRTEIDRCRAALAALEVSRSPASSPAP
jgi:glycerol-3-phosphate dehydrogenase